MQKIFLYGASGHAKVVIDILDSIGEKPMCLFDDNHNVSELNGYKVQPFDSISSEDALIITIGNNKIRKKIAERFNTDYKSAVHYDSVISKTSSIGKGTVIMAGVVVNAGAEIGAHCIINTNASVDHDCLLEDYVHLSPNVALCGNVTIGEGTHVGAGSVIIPGITIGKWCTIGAGSVVVKNIPDYCKAYGNPCRVITIEKN